MQQLTEHFTREEFELEEPMPDECVPIFTVLCQTLLEPIRTQFGEKPYKITSGYRTVAGNEATHGVPDSDHIATTDRCAADGLIIGVPMREVFDWVRNNPKLLWHQLILEHGKYDDIVHISVDKLKNTRIAKEGDTHNQSAYTDWPVVTYNV